MSEIRVNNITNREGSAGPSVAGIPVVDSNSHFVVPTGRTGQRYADGGENIVRDGLVLYLDAKYSYPSKTGITSTTDSLDTDVYTWYDLSGYENQGELKSGVSYSGNDGGFLDFDGSTTNSTVVVGNTVANSFSQITVECWIKPDTVPSSDFVFEEIFGADDGSSGDLESVFLIAINHNNIGTGLPASFVGNVITFGVRTIGQVERNRPILIPSSASYDLFTYGMAMSVNPSEYVANTWMNLTGVYTGEETFLYINGQFKGSSSNQPNGGNKSVKGILNNSFITRNIGSSSGGDNRFDGKVAVSKIYDRALTPQEIQQNFNATRSRYGI